jgi:hypothetical protein
MCNMKIMDPCSVEEPHHDDTNRFRDEKIIRLRPLFSVLYKNEKRPISFNAAPDAARNMMRLRFRLLNTVKKQILKKSRSLREQKPNQTKLFPIPR